MTAQAQLTVVFGRERVDGGDLLDAHEAAELLGCLGEELTVGAHDLLRVLEAPEHRTGEDLADRVGLEEEAGDDAEVAAAAAQAPEQVGMVGRAGRHQSTVGEDDVGLEEVVDGQAVLTRQVPDAATEGESGDAGGRDDAEGYGETVGMSGVVDVAGGAAGGDAHGSVLDVDADPAHPGQVDDQPVVHAAETGTVVRLRRGSRLPGRPPARSRHR